MTTTYNTLTGLPATETRIYPDETIEFVGYDMRDRHDITGFTVTSETMDEEVLDLCRTEVRELVAAFLFDGESLGGTEMYAAMLDRETVVIDHHTTGDTFHVNLEVDDQ